MNLFLCLTAIFMVVLYVNTQEGTTGGTTDGTTEETTGGGTDETTDGTTEETTEGTTARLPTETERDEECALQTAPCNCAGVGDPYWTSTNDICTFYCRNGDEDISCDTESAPQCQSEAPQCDCNTNDRGQPFWVMGAGSCEFYCRDSDEYTRCDDPNNAAMKLC